MPTELRLPKASGIIAGLAGALWPYKFVTGVLDHLSQKFPWDFVIETDTIVTRKERNSSPQYHYDQF